MSEHRASERKRVLKAGKIVFNRAGAIDSIVKNLSSTGAMLQVESAVGIPDEFTLVIESDQLTRPCRVAWRKPQRIGVTFL